MIELAELLEAEDKVVFTVYLHLIEDDTIPEKIIHQSMNDDLAKVLNGG